MSKTKQPKWKAAFFARCPACGKGKLLKGLIKIRQSCPECGEDFSQYKTADGPAFFAITIIGTLAGGGAAAVEVIHEPSIWTHLAIWLPVTAIGSVIVIRITKGLMAAHQYQLGHQGMNQ